VQRPRNGRQLLARRRASGFDAFPPLPGKVFVDEVRSLCFFFSLPYFEFLGKGAFSWLAVYLVEELILALGTTHLQLVGVVWLVSS
jgi:hypothetical protein